MRFLQINENPRNKAYIFYVFFVVLLLGFEEARCKVNKKIIIVGAGSSGIAAASKLLENGFTNITILEAEDRIGGRVYTTKIGDYWVDLGAQWLNGVVGNTAYDLANPLDLIDVQNISRYDRVLYDSAGNAVSNETNYKFMKFLEKLYEDTKSNKIKVDAKSFGEFIDKAFVKYFKDVPEFINDKNKYLHFLEFSKLGLNPAKSWYDLPVNKRGGYIGYKNEHHGNWKTRGYGLILDILMKYYPDPEKELPVKNKTILNSEVTSINYIGTNNSEPIVVTTKGGQVYTADHVIVTVSLGVLKEKHRSLFTPPLSDEKVNTIEGVDFGSFGKVFLLFEKPFWQYHGIKALTNGFLWNDSDRKAIEQDPDEMWLLGVLGVQTVEHKPNLLEISISGDSNVKAMEKIPEEKVFNQTIQLLERFMGKTHNVSKPIAMIRTQWYTNPHFRGAYSYRGLDMIERKINPDLLVESITPQNLNILFAGEATSPRHFGQVDGAIESGWTAAEKLITFYKNESF